VSGKPVKAPPGAFGVEEDLATPIITAIGGDANFSGIEVWQRLETDG
jgi:hypothetical protein